MTLTTTRSNMSVVGSISWLANVGTLACRHVLAVINHSAERPSAHAAGRATA